MPSFVRLFFAAPSRSRVFVKIGREVQRWVSDSCSGNAKAQSKGAGVILKLLDALFSQKPRKPSKRFLDSEAQQGGTAVEDVQAAYKRVQALIDAVAPAAAIPIAEDRLSN